MVNKCATLITLLAQTIHYAYNYYAMLADYNAARANKHCYQWSSKAEQSFALYSYDAITTPSYSGHLSIKHNIVTCIFCINQWSGHL